MPGKSHGQRSLVGCGPWGREESDTTEQLPFQFSLSCIGEVNGNPLQCSCLENPRDGGAWWAAVYGVTQSLTRVLNRPALEAAQWGFSGGTVVKNTPANAGDRGDAGLIPGLRRPPGVGHGTHSSILVWKIP